MLMYMFDTEVFKELLTEAGSRGGDAVA